MSNRNLSVVSGEGRPERAPVAAAKVLGNHLKRLREQAGLYQSDVVKAGVVTSTPVLSKYENARTPFQKEQLVKLVTFYAPHDPNALAEVLHLAEQAAAPEWWGEYRDVLPGHIDRLFSQEAAAREIRQFESVYVPGLLQTPDYARALMKPAQPHSAKGLSKTDEDALRRRMFVRHHRQLLLSLPSAPDFYAVLDEAVLARAQADQHVMRGQLRHLYAVAENSRRIGIRVLPFNAPHHLRPGHASLTLLGMPPGSGDDLVYIESSNVGGSYLTERAEVEDHRQRLSKLWGAAAGKDETLAIIEKYINTL
ncbi:helix-turn-helix domain-containing protein [Streptomyces albidoflavus]|uniref:helix-turn-helix domain-containing protein n=1 Tax=Streptomyces albidoflavus TaxID=1886 RepID=UPI00101E58A7|nr:helix-turn-helix transcriptional regulator [Streptomyces albidoflavus]